MSGGRRSCVPILAKPLHPRRAPRRGPSWSRARRPAAPGAAVMTPRVAVTHDVGDLLWERGRRARFEAALSCAGLSAVLPVRLRWASGSAQPPRRRRRPQAGTPALPSPASPDPGLRACEPRLPGNPGSVANPASPGTGLGACEPRLPGNLGSVANPASP